RATIRTSQRRSPMTLINRAGLVSVACILAVVGGGTSQVHGQARGFPNVVDALRVAPGCLGVETGQTASGGRVIFAGCEGKRALVEWYHSDVHQKAMRTVFPDTPFEGQPLPDLP